MLYTLKASKCKLQKAILKNCDDELIHCLSEIVQNVLNGNVPLVRKHLNCLRKYKKEMRQIRSYNSKKKSVGAKRKILVQKGGFIQAILGALLSSVVGSLINKLT